MWLHSSVLCSVLTKHACTLEEMFISQSEATIAWEKTLLFYGNFMWWNGDDEVEKKTGHFAKYFILGHTLCRSVWYMIDMHVDWTPSLSDSQVEWEIFLPSLVRYKNLAWCRQTNVHTRSHAHTHTPENSLITFVNVIYFYVSKARICDFLLSSHIVFFSASGLFDGAKMIFFFVLVFFECFSSSFVDFF